MEGEFEGLTVLDERPAEVVLEETESRLRSEVEAQGLNPIEGKDTRVQFSKRSTNELDSVEDLDEYLYSCTGLQPVDLVVYAEGRGGRGSAEIAESVDMRLDWNTSEFSDTYTLLEDHFDVKTASFSVSGYGESAVEAYSSAVPMITFLLDSEGQDLGVTLSYRDEGTIETMWGEEEETFRELYHALWWTGLEYEGAALEGEEESEWIVADYGFSDPAERR